MDKIWVRCKCNFTSGRFRSTASMEHELLRRLAKERFSNAGQVDVVSLCRAVRSSLHQERLNTGYNWTFCFASKKPRTLDHLSDKCRKELLRSTKSLVWNVEATDTPGDPRLPESCRDLFEASNMCHVSYDSVHHYSRSFLEPDSFVCRASPMWQHC